MPSQERTVTALRTALFLLRNLHPFNPLSLKTTYAPSLDIHLYKRRKKSAEFSTSAAPPRRNPRMSTATAKHPGPEPEYGHLVRLTVQACQVAKEAAGAAAEGIATGSSPLLNSLRQREKELDRLD